MRSYARYLSPAEEKDTALLLSFIRALAEYEHMLDQVVATEAILQEWLFDRKVAEAFFALEDETEVGFALYFHNFSTFLGRGGIYLEDLFILPEHRGKGYGKAILQRLAQIARERGCGRLEWACLDWNKPSIDFYLSLGAVPMDEWTVYRVSGASLIQLSGEGAEQTQDWEELS
jgi:GNAT superfamily N-acetyltransferase